MQADHDRGQRKTFRLSLIHEGYSLLVTHSASRFRIETICMSLPALYRRAEPARRRTRLPVFSSFSALNSSHFSLSFPFSPFSGQPQSQKHISLSDSQQCPSGPLEKQLGLDSYGTNQRIMMACSHSTWVQSRPAWPLFASSAQLLQTPALAYCVLHQYLARVRGSSIVLATIARSVALSGNPEHARRYRHSRQFSPLCRPLSLPPHIVPRSFTRYTLPGSPAGSTR